MRTWHSRGTSHHLPLPFLFPIMGRLPSPLHPTTAIPCMWHFKEALRAITHQPLHVRHTGSPCSAEGLRGTFRMLHSRRQMDADPSPIHTQPYSHNSTKRHRVTQTHKAGDKTTNEHQGSECISSSSPLPSHHHLPTMSQQPCAPIGRVSIQETCKGAPGELRDVSEHT